MSTFLAVRDVGVFPCPNHDAPISLSWILKEPYGPNRTLASHGDGHPRIHRGVANELTKRGTFIYPTGVRSVWLRNDLHTFQRRLKALEAKLGQEPGRVPTESQVQAMKKAKLEKEAHGEIETAHPDYPQHFARCINTVHHWHVDIQTGDVAEQVVGKTDCLGRI